MYHETNQGRLLNQCGVGCQKKEPKQLFQCPCERQVFNLDLDLNNGSNSRPALAGCTTFWWTNYPDWLQMLNLPQTETAEPE